MIVVTGEALIDLVVETDGSVTAAQGGAPFNTARACGRLGADVEFIGALSVDRFGTLMYERLVTDRVAVARAPRVDLPTTLAAGELDERGAATYRFYIHGTSATALTDLPTVGDTDIAYTGGLGLVLEPMAGTIERWIVDTVHPSGAMVMVDVNCRPLVISDRTAYVDRVMRVLAATDIAKVSDEDLEYLFPDRSLDEAAATLLEVGPAAVLLTAGGEHVRVITAGGDASVAVEPVEVVDTIGAGDTFGGAFLAWWTDSGAGRDEAGSLDHLVPAVRAATTIAGIVCSRRGADPPWRSELAEDWGPAR